MSADEVLEEITHLQIHESAFNGEYEKVEAFINEPGVDIDVPDKTGMTPFLFAVWGGHFETAKMLQDAGADINHVAHSTGNGAMHLVASQSHFDMVKWIVDTLGEKGLSGVNHLGRNPLHMACQAGSIESLEYLVEAGGDLTAMATNGDTPLHVSVAEGHIKMCNELIELGADYDAPNKLGYTPLHVAVQAGHQHIVHDLVSIPEIEIHKNARNGMSAVVLAEKGEGEHPEIAKMLRDAAALRPPPLPKKAVYTSRTTSRIATRGKAIPGRGLIRAESKATLNSKKVINKFENMLNSAETEEALRLQALKDLEESRRKEKELGAVRQAHEVELAKARMEEERLQRIEEKKKKMLEAEKEEQARKDAGEKMRLLIEAEKLKEKQRKGAAEQAIQQAKAERVAKEAADKVEAARLAAEKLLKEEAEERRLREAEAQRVADKLAAEKAAALAQEQRDEAARQAAAQKAEQELLALQRAEAAEKEAERRRLETERLAAQLQEEQRRRDEISMQGLLQKQLDDDAAERSKYEAAKARAEAEKAIAEAEKAKADAERANAERDKALAEAALSKRKSEILEQAAKIRHEEAEDAKLRRMHAQQHLDRQRSFDQQRLDLDAEVSKAERAARDKKEAWKAAQMQAEVEAMRLKLEAVESKHREELEEKTQRKNRFEQVVDLTASSHAGLSLKRLNDRARMSQRSICAGQGVQQKRLHNFVKTQSMPDTGYRFNSFSSADPSDRGGRQSTGGVGSPPGRASGGRFSSPGGILAHRHSIGGDGSSPGAAMGSSSRWDKLRSNVLDPNGQYHGHARMDTLSRKSYSADRRVSYGEVDTPLSPEVSKIRKSVSMSIPSPLPSPSASLSSGPRASNRFLTKSNTVGYTPVTSGSVVTPPPPAPLTFSPGGVYSLGSGSGSESDFESGLSESLTPNDSSSGGCDLDQFSPPGVTLAADIELEVNSPEPKGQSFQVTSSTERDDQREQEEQEDEDEEGAELTPSQRLSVKKRAEADRVRARRQAEARNFEKRKYAAEAVAVQDHKILQAAELAKVLYLEKVIDHASTEQAKVEAEEASRVRAAQTVIQAANLQKMSERDVLLEHKRQLMDDKSHSSQSVEEKKSQTDHSDQPPPPPVTSSRPPMAPRVKSLVLGDFSIRHLPLKKSDDGSLVKVGSFYSLKSDASELKIDQNAYDSTIASVGSGEELLLQTRVQSPVLKKRFSSSSEDADSPKPISRFSSGSNGGSSGFGENKSIDNSSQPQSNPKKYSSQSRSGSGSEEEVERQRQFQNGVNGGNSNSFVQRSLSSQNHVHNNSAARLGDLVINNKLSTSELFRVETMDDFDDMFGDWIDNQSKWKLHETYPEDHLQQETSLDTYIVETLRRSTEIEWRLGQLEDKMPNPRGIKDIRKLLHAKDKTLKQLRDRKTTLPGLSTQQLSELRNELHSLRNQCLDAVDRERVELKDPEHILQEEFDQISNL